MITVGIASGVVQHPYSSLEPSEAELAAAAWLSRLSVSTQIGPSVLI